MLFVKEGNVTLEGGFKENIPEALCGLVVVMESLYVGGNEVYIDKVIKPELEKIMKINSIKDLRKYERGKM